MDTANIKRQFLEVAKKLIEHPTAARQIGGLLEWLETTSFFDDPASTRYHSSFPGGLAKHSIGKAQKLVDLTAANKLVWEHPASPLMIGLFHDICKAGTYQVEYRNVKKEGVIANNGWVKEPFYTFKDPWPLGHGEKSVVLLMRYNKLTDEEVFCIRYHMGPGDDERGFSDACKLYPNVLWTHVADRLATMDEDREEAQKNAPVDPASLLPGKK
jgi:HD superfamily phosphohydrolase YqeK